MANEWTNFPVLFEGCETTMSISSVGIPESSQEGLLSLSQPENKTKKTRTVYSKKQISGLESMFYCKRYLNHADRLKLSGELSLSENQIKVWFQNRRNKWKKDMILRFQNVVRYEPIVTFSHVSKREKPTKKLSNYSDAFSWLTENGTFNLPMTSIHLDPDVNNTASSYSKDCCYGNTELLVPNARLS